MIELSLKHKHMLLGVFYRPHNSDTVVFSAIEDSIKLAVDSGVNDNEPVHVISNNLTF